MTASLPRPVLLALIGTVLFAGLFMFTRSRSGGSEPATTPSTSSAPTPATPAPAEQSKPDTSAAAPPAATGPNAEGAARTADSKTSGEGLPVAVGRALEAKKVVVLLFWNSKAVDDRSVHASVAKLSRHGGSVAVFDDTVKNLSHYTRITATAQVTQTPSLVIVDRRGSAQVRTGYLDFETIDQFVDTARKR
jgi:hypothetical protein